MLNFELNPVGRRQDNLRRSPSTVDDEKTNVEPVTVRNAITGGATFELGGGNVSQARIEVGNTIGLPAYREVVFIRGCDVLGDEDLILDGDQYFISERPDITKLRKNKQREYIQKFVHNCAHELRGGLNLLMSIFSNSKHAIEINESNKSFEIKFGEYYDESRFLDIFKNNDTDRVKSTNAYKVLLKDFLATNIFHYIAKPESLIQDREFNTLIETLRELPDYIVETPESFLRIVDALMKYKPIDEGNRTWDFRNNLISVLKGLPDCIMETPESFLIIVDALMKYKPIDEGKKRAWDFRNLISDLIGLPDYIVETPESFLRIVDALMEYNLIDEGEKRASDFMNLINDARRDCEETLLDKNQ